MLFAQAGISQAELCWHRLLPVDQQQGWRYNSRACWALSDTLADQDWLKVKTYTQSKV